MYAYANTLKEALIFDKTCNTKGESYYIEEKHNETGEEGIEIGPNPQSIHNII